jgi:hypothetical protein
MDPNANVQEMLELSQRIQHSLASFDESWMALRLAELVEALDGWLIHGGAPPDRWLTAFKQAVKGEKR